MEVTIDPADAEPSSGEVDTARGDAEPTSGDADASADAGVDGSSRSPNRTSPTRDHHRERVRVRNHDYDRTYDVTVTARPARDGSVPLSRRPQVTDGVRTTYEVTPGAVTCDRDAVPPGVYDVEVRTDDGATDRVRCHVDDAPGSTIVVELGNGIVSVTSED